MLADVNTPLKDIFLGMTGDNRKLLCKVENLETLDGLGYVGWINGERVMIGSRRLMDTYDIQLPSMEYERRHTVNQRRVIYLAVSGKLFSMFQVAYQSDPDTAAVLDFRSLWTAMTLTAMKRCCRLLITCRLVPSRC